jgi:hypothetical protein
MSDPMDLELIRLIAGDLPPAPAEPDEDTLWAACNDRLYQDWRHAPWWRPWARTAVAVVLLAAVFTALFIVAGA